MLQGNKDLETHPLFAFLGFTVITHRFYSIKAECDSSVMAWRFQCKGNAISLKRRWQISRVQFTFFQKIHLKVA